MELLGIGSRVKHPAYGDGVIIRLHVAAYEVCFVQFGLKMVGKDYANWQIVDLTGRILNEGIFAAEQVEFRIPVASLTQGAYILRVTANNEVVTQQFRKQ